MAGRRREPRYLPIEEHGIIGDMHTAALVGVNGAIDWMCFPHFDSPSIFASILDADKGGYFRIAPVDDGWKSKQLYHPDSNVLITRFLLPDGLAEVVDFMPIAESGHRRHEHLLVRRVSAVRGAVKLRVECKPAFDYGRADHVTRIHKSKGAAFHARIGDDDRAGGDADDLTLGLATSVPLRRVDGGAAGEFTLHAGESVSFALRRIGRRDGPGRVLAEREYEELHHSTVDFWRNWLSHCTYFGRWRDMVLRSALVLKLMIYEPTGAIVAAPTTSLPESIGHNRNWDYRYTWIRDAAFTLYALLNIGFTTEAERFMGWVEARCRELDGGGSLQVMYGIDGRHELDEETLDHLEGYMGSRPVRIGNAAYQQLQLDIYGELMDSIYLYDRDATPVTYDLWNDVRKLMNWLTKHWQKPDKGIWEVRGEPRQLTYSKVMCWVAFDRALRIQSRRGLPGEAHDWERARSAVYEEVMQRGWSAQEHAFSQAYDGRLVDASTLLCPVVKFTGPTDPRFIGTLNAIQQNLVTDSLVYRYPPNEDAGGGIEGPEGTFSLCTFWYVEGLVRAGRLDDARLVLEKMFTYANHLGLFSEQIGPSGEALGNFPQALTHLSLITAAYNLNRSLEHPRGAQTLPAEYRR